MEIEIEDWSMKVQTVVDRLDEVDMAIIEDRNAELKQVERDMEMLGEIFTDLSVLVEFQGDELDRLADTTEVIVVNVEEGVKALEKAEVHQRSYRSKFVTGALVSGTVAVGGVAVAVVLSPLIGIIAAGCGVAGTVGCLGMAFKRT